MTTRLMPILMALLTHQAHAVTLPLADDFQDGTAQAWTGSDTTNIANVGPSGAGDHSLEVTSFKRFVTYNQSQWSGDWNSAGISQLSMDIRHSNEFDLTLWLGISQGTPLPAGAGDTYVTTQSITVPGDDAWHTIMFDVSATDFVPAPSNTAAIPDTSGALSAVQQLRIIHSPTQSFIGSFVEGSMLVDNIRVVPEPNSLWLVWMCSTAGLLCRSSQRLRGLAGELS